jgi:hypothetical protein
MNVRSWSIVAYYRLSFLYFLVLKLGGKDFIFNAEVRKG